MRIDVYIHEDMTTFQKFAEQVLKHIEELKKEITKMASKADLDAAIASLNQTITDEATKLQAAIDALEAQIVAGGDLSAEVQALQDAQTRIAGLPTTPTPPTPTP